MKGHSVGADVGLLWPDRVAMLDLYKISRPRNQLIVPDPDTEDLLWPSELINTQVQLLQRRRDFSTPLAALVFVASIILGVIIGPVRLALIAMTLDYNWVNAAFYPRALHYVLIVAGLMAIVNIIALVLSWDSRPKRTVLTLALAVATWLELAAIWLGGNILSMQPHEFVLLFVTLTLGLIVAILLISKQHIPLVRNSKLIKTLIGVTVFLSAIEVAFSIIYLINTPHFSNSEQAMQISIDQQLARLENVPVTLSDLTYVLCSGKYQVIYLSDTQTSGLFECKGNGDVYSVEDPGQKESSVVRGNATYLGTTKSKDITLNFPMSHYLFRSLPGLSEDELALMMPAKTEHELLDTITVQLYNYWQSHAQRNLYVNIFYNPSLDNINSTRDFVLLAAMDTMARVDQLPNGNTRSGALDGKIVPYIYRTDTSLKALNELGANPDNYAAQARDALKLYRHLSLRLYADSEITYEELYAQLQESFVDPNIINTDYEEE